MPEPASTTGRREIFVFPHIPKAGGTSVKATLKRVFGKPGYGDTTSLYNDYQYTREQVAEVLRQNPQLRILTGHKLSLDLPFRAEDWILRPFTFVRDPVNRFLSLYYYLHGHPELNFRVSQLSLDDYLDPANRKHLPNLESMSQLRFLTGQEGEAGRERIEACLRDYGLMLFPLDQLGLAMAYLCHRFPEVFHACEKFHLNKNAWDPPPTDEQRARIREQVQDDLWLHQRSQDYLAEATRGLDLDIPPDHRKEAKPAPLPVSVALEKFGNIFTRLAASIEKRRQQQHAAQPDAGKNPD